MDDNYWKTENPNYIELELKIEQKKHKIDSGIITNERKLKQARRDLRIWRERLSKTEQYIE